MVTKFKSLTYEDKEKLIDKLEIVEKGWEVKLSEIEEGYLYCDVYCRAEDRNKAKSEFLKRDEVRDMTLRFSDDDVSYINLPIQRCKKVDKVVYKGEVVTRSSVWSLIENEEHNRSLDSILEDDSIEFCYIRKRGEYYRPNKSGYTSKYVFAGVYEKKDAVSQARNITEITIIPIDIEEHNKRINDLINEVKNNLI